MHIPHKPAFIIARNYPVDLLVLVHKLYAVYAKLFIIVYKRKRLDTKCPWTEGRLNILIYIHGIIMHLLKKKQDRSVYITKM